MPAMRSGIRTLLVSAAAVSLAACAIRPAQPAWFSSAMFEELVNAEDYANVLAARYAGAIGEPVAAAGFYRRSFDRTPNDPVLLERAALATMIAGGVEDTVALAQIGRAHV